MEQLKLFLSLLKMRAAFSQKQSAELQAKNSKKMVGKRLEDTTSFGNI